LKLADFGLAAACPASGHSLFGAGTEPYMSVEQLLGFCNSGCDVWACGCILFEFMTCEMLVPDVLPGDFNCVIDFIRSEHFDAKLIEAVQDYGRDADVCILLRMLCTLDWSLGPSAEDSCVSYILINASVRKIVSFHVLSIMVCTKSIPRRHYCLSVGLRIGAKTRRHIIMHARRSRNYLLGMFLRLFLGHGMCTGRIVQIVFILKMLDPGSAQWTCLLGSPLLYILHHILRTVVSNITFVRGLHTTQR